MVDAVLQRFAKRSPAMVMIGGLLERVFSPEQLDALFERTADRQYTRELLFSTVFDLMSQVVCGIQPSMHAAYQEQTATLSVSLTSVYNKLNGIEPSTSSALVRYSADVLAPLVDSMGAMMPPFLPGYRLKIVDGHCLDATEHRLSELRLLPSGALPGKSLVVYDPSLQMVTDALCCADGHAQERSLIEGLYPLIHAGEVWLADRNFCTRAFLGQLTQQQAYFVIRHHANLPWEPAGLQCPLGRIETGAVIEQRVRIVDDQEQPHRWRRIVLRLDEPTRDGDTHIVILSNLPEDAVSGLEIARLYRRRWTVERAFQDLAQHLNAELNTLGYPPAALFAFCVALVAYNILAVIKAALRAVHGTEKIDQEFSGYYLAIEIGNTARGMMIAIDAKAWSIFRTWSVPQLSDFLIQLAQAVDLRQYKKHPRGPKKPKAKKRTDERKPHVSTARLIAQRKKILNAP